MQFTPQLLDNIRARISVREIVGRHVNLKSKGGGKYLGLCPFHKEKTPSFTVTDSRDTYHCFGCGAHGDIIKFIMENQGLSFPETVKKLAGEAGLELPREDPVRQEYYEKRGSLYDISEAATKIFEANLWGRAGAQARGYLQKRGLSDEIIKKFRLGFSLDNGSALKKSMLDKGFDEQQLFDVGLVVRPENNRESYDRFRARVIFPIMDYKNRIIAFGGRILSDKMPKYLNSPETELFHKSNVLYNFNYAREAAYKQGDLVVVEGYMDVIALAQAGINNAVAPLGTAVTQNHVKLMWKAAKEPIICLDGDEAGKRAMRKLSENSLEILQEGYSLKFANLPTGEDPDDVVKNYGVKAFRDILTSATALSQELWLAEKSSGLNATPEQRANLEKRLMSLVAKIENISVKNYYKNFFRSKLWDFNRGNYKKVNPKNEIKTNALRSLINVRNEAKIRYENLLLITAINNPKIIENYDVEDILLHINFSSQEAGALRDEIMNFIHGDEIEEDLSAYLEKTEHKDYIKFINSGFIDGFAKSGAQESTVRLGWDYILACYNFELMQEEYSISVKTMSEKSPEKVWELKKQKDMLKKLVESKKISYEAILN